MLDEDSSGMGQYYKNICNEIPRKPKEASSTHKVLARCRRTNNTRVSMWIHAPHPAAIFFSLPMEYRDMCIRSRQYRKIPRLIPSNLVVGDVDLSGSSRLRRLDHKLSVIERGQDFGGFQVTTSYTTSRGMNSYETSQRKPTATHSLIRILVTNQ